MNPDDDYVYSGSEEDVVAEPSPVLGPTEQTSRELLVAGESAERTLEQSATDLPVIAEGSVEAAPTEKSKKTSKRARKDVSTSGVERSSLAGRHIHYSDVGFVDDKGACANVLYALKHADAPTSIPPLNELEESETYARYARSEMRSKALLNKIVLNYQRKLTDARQALKDADRLNELKADLDKQRNLVACLALKLHDQKDENNSLQTSLLAKNEELEQSEGRCQRTWAELRALGGYSKGVKAQADRLQKRLVYLDQVKTPAKRADQARSSMKCVQALVKRKVNVPPKTLEDMEKHAMEFEAEVKKFAPVELEEGDLTPIGAYVPISDEFDELLGTECPPMCDEDVIMGNTSVEEAPEAIRDAAPARSNEEGGSGQAE